MGTALLCGYDHMSIKWLSVVLAGSQWKKYEYLIYLIRLVRKETIEGRRVTSSSSLCSQHLSGLWRECECLKYLGFADLLRVYLGQTLTLTGDQNFYRKNLQLLKFQRSLSLEAWWAEIVNTFFLVEDSRCQFIPLLFWLKYFKSLDTCLKFLQRRV